MARGYKVVTATLTAQNTFTPHIHPADKPTGERVLNVSIRGIVAATVTFQRTFDGGATWGDIAQYAADDAVNGDVEFVYQCGSEGVEAYRLGIQTGDYAGADSIVCRLGH